MENETPVWGAEKIGAVIGLDVRPTYGLLEAGLLPAKKVGKRWVAMPSKLRQHLSAEARQDSA